MSLSKLLFRIAGVDAAVMERCPGIDRIWAIQLGMSLVINFWFIFFLATYSIGYIFQNPYARTAVAGIIAAVIVLFDRALFQSDWFQMNLVSQIREAIEEEQQTEHKAKLIFYYVSRIFFRLAISIVIAYTLALFVELAVFSDAVSERIEQKFSQDNTVFYQKLRDAGLQIDGQIAKLGSAISKLTNDIVMTQNRSIDSNDKRALDNDWDQLRKIQEEVSGLERKISKDNDSVRELQDDVEAEKNGIKLKPQNTGLVGCGTVCQTKLGMIANLKQEIHQWEVEIAQKKQEIRDLEQKINAIAAKYAQVDEAKAALAEMKSERDKLQKDRDRLQATREKILAGKEDELRRSGLYFIKRDDPIIRIRYLDDLKNDPERGGGVKKISSLVIFFIMFLEIVPVLAKLFFSPPSAYAMYARAEVAKGQLIACKDISEKLKEYKTVELNNKKEIYDLARARKERMNASRIFDEEELKYWLDKSKKGGLS